MGRRLLQYFQEAIGRSVIESLGFVQDKDPVMSRLEHESLKDTAARTLPYFSAKIMPDVQKGLNIIVAAHGNSLRSIVMHLDKLTQEQVLNLNLGTGIPIIYEINAQGAILSKAELK